MSLNLQVETMFQMPILGPFLDRLYRSNLKENNFLKEFGARQVGLVKVGSK